MRKLLLLFILISFIILIISAISCNREQTYTAEEWEKVQKQDEFQKSKEELIEFDKEYILLVETYEKEFEEFKEYFEYYTDERNTQDVQFVPRTN